MAQVIGYKSFEENWVAHEKKKSSDCVVALCVCGKDCYLEKNCGDTILSQPRGAWLNFGQAVRATDKIRM